jgi:hypothetical protein
MHSILLLVDFYHFPSLKRFKLESSATSKEERSETLNVTPKLLTLYSPRSSNLYALSLIHSRT